MDELPFGKQHTNLDIWKLIFDDEMIDHIPNCTNSLKYVDRSTPFPNVTREELERYFAIYYCLSLLQFPQERFPWFEDADSVLSELPVLYSNSFISSIMGKNRWMNIHHAFHCTSDEVRLVIQSLILKDADAGNYCHYISSKIQENIHKYYMSHFMRAMCHSR